MLKDFLKLENTKEISRKEQKTINGGISGDSICFGIGVTSAPNDEGTSPACVNRNGNCIINGYRAVCSGNSQGGFYYL
ncbi:hypothetical protein [Aquimarina sp. Aq107]|uniref:hypothetical protein n=1 Tax=Aquimarina sp. Aq107 TaxID=1191912 RepID=UPI000D54C461|nr:hypothetical protein [Aquimarina sp. Aq107]